MNKAKLAAAVAEYAADPFGHALFAYPWGAPETPLANVDHPRRWQGEVLREIGDHLANPLTRFTPLRIAVASGHGPGKSALIAMVSKWAVDTCPDARVVVTANTENQLITKTSPELAKWHRMAITSEWFRPSVMSIASAEPGHAHSWRLDCIPWSIHQPEAFAGLHNRGRRIVLIFDEASSIADKIWEVAEGALTDEDTEIIWLALGNPTRNVGRFRECFGKYRHLWSIRHIDSRTVEGTNKAYLDEMVATYGEDSDIVKVRVRGQFPSASSMQFIGTDLVQAATERVLAASGFLDSYPVVFGLDHARFGDDSTVLAIRQGTDARSRPWRVWNGATSMEIAGDVAAEATRHKADAIFVDAGGPNAGGVIDRLRQLLGTRAAVFEINFGGKGREATWNGEVRTRTANKRAEMYTNLRAWLDRGTIPDHPRLVQDLTVIEYTYNTDNAVLLERKEHLRSRGLQSTDWSDALALTFAEAVAHRRRPGEFDPFLLPMEHYNRFDELR